MKCLGFGNVFPQVHQGRLSEERSRKYFQQLIDAVDYCHGKGVSHRDLKVLVNQHPCEICFLVCRMIYKVKFAFL